MRLSEWAKREGVAYITAWRWWNEGKLPVPARKVGKLILVDVPEPDDGRTVVYARVSSADQKPTLIGRWRGWSHGRRPVRRRGRPGGDRGRVRAERQRRKFLGLLRDPAVDTIVVEHRDRFARFGAEYVEAALAASGRGLLVVDPSEVDDDLVGT